MTLSPLLRQCGFAKNGTLTVLLAFGLLSSTVARATAPFEKGDAVKGKALVESQCVRCHQARFGGDGSAIYTREDHKIRNAKALLTQIRYCQTMLDKQWFDEDELNAARYLNDQYYHFTDE